MPFTTPWSSRIYRIFQEIVETEGYNCRRADDYYGRVVLDDVWKRLNEASFVIADLTSENPNVYYELGIAHTLGKEIIPIIQSRSQIPFDQQPFRVLIYEDNADGYEVPRSRLPRWITSLEYNSSPQILLKRGLVSRFNEWRASHEFVDLSNADLSGLDLTGINLSGALLRGTILRGSILKMSKLRAAKMTSADLRDVIFDESVISEGHMSEANLLGASFRECDLSGAVIIRSELTDASTCEANFLRANLSESVLIRANLRRADLREGIWLRVKLDGADLQGARISGLTVEKATWNRYRAVFEQAVDTQEVIIES